MSGHWTYDRASGSYRCEFPGCTFQTPNLGAMQLHWRRKDHAALLAQEAGGKGEEPDGAGEKTPPARTPTVCPDCGGKSFRLLNKSDPIERQYIEAGFRAVCTKCNEVV